MLNYDAALGMKGVLEPVLASSLDFECAVYRLQTHSLPQGCAPDDLPTDHLWNVPGPERVVN